MIGGADFVCWFVCVLLCVFPPLVNFMLLSVLQVACLSQIVTYEGRFVHKDLGLLDGNQSMFKIVAK